MAKVVKDFEFPKNRRCRYPWDKWLDGQVWELEKGKDYVVSLAQMRNNVYSAAWSRGLRCRTSFVRGRLYVQAFHAKTDKDAA